LLIVRQYEAPVKRAIALDRLCQADPFA
jgi:hypothetical protein